MSISKVISKIFGRWYRKHNIFPMFWVTIDTNKYPADKSCEYYCLPSMANDIYITERIKEIIIHIRDSYDIDEIKDISRS